jgi:hypothetical protein
MKKHIILAVALFTALCNNIYSQDYAPNGGIFTPRGDLCAFVLFVGFGDVDTLNPIGCWNDSIPDKVKDGRTYYFNSKFIVMKFLLI